MSNLLKLDKTLVLQETTKLIKKYISPIFSPTKIGNDHYIGYFHKIENLLLYNKPLDETKLTEILINDLVKIAIDVDKLVIVNLNNFQAIAILSFVHNLGITNFQNSTLLKKLNQGSFFEASQEFLKWIKVNNVPNELLKKRRLEESSIFLTGLIKQDNFLERLLAVLNNKGYQINLKPFQPNLVGIRSPNRKADKFDDLFINFYMNDRDSWVIEKSLITTDPGLKVLKAPINVKGTAVLVSGQYIDCWRYGLHKNKYPALVQVRDVLVYRDNNRNDIIEVELDESNPLGFKIEKGIFGINIHHASKIVEESKEVKDWSAGCQVFARYKKEWIPFINFIDDYNKLIYNKYYSYTLINSKDYEFNLLY
jgi:lysozyme